ncbi:CCHC-type domain-containing protein [Trichonephila clavata]|uniref:CCHC-type domain-containing protein n=1 Tax=Trichonephila clavata TaxID=2740835 RepID=A0A8X6LU32_TRICU|nr:CCHC-type domain-containing protein [Trichonephila clavata]
MPRPFGYRGHEDSLKWLKEYDRVAKFNEWKGIMCFANVYFFIDATDKQWRSRTPAQRLPTQPRKTDVWGTVDNRPVCFHCGRSGHVLSYCRERKAIFDSYRNHRQSFNEIDAEEGTHTPNIFLVLHLGQLEADHQHTVSDRRRRIVDPFDLQAVGMRENKRVDLKRR